MLPLCCAKLTQNPVFQECLGRTALIELGGNETSLIFLNLFLVEEDDFTCYFPFANLSPFHSLTQDQVVLLPVV